LTLVSGYIIVEFIRCDPQKGVNFLFSADSCGFSGFEFILKEFNSELVFVL